MKVAIFKSEGGNFKKYLDLLNENDFEVQLVPSLDFVYKNLELYQQRLNNRDEFSGLIFTSPRAVLATKEALGDDVLDQNWMEKLNYSVGETTWTECKKFLNLETKGRESGNAQKLSDLITSDLQGQKDLPPFLFPCGNLRQDILQKNLESAGLTVASVEIYETVPHPKLKEKLLTILDEPAIEYLAFFSPSGVNFCQEIAKSENKVLSTKKLIAIGPSTKQAMDGHGLTVYGTADSPTPEGLLTALCHNKRKFEGKQVKKS